MKIKNFKEKKYPELDAILDEHFKKEGIFELDHRDDNPTSLGMSGNSAERLYAYVNGVLAKIINN